jgi:hypothetical protein
MPSGPHGLDLRLTRIPRASGLLLPKISTAGECAVRYFELRDLAPAIGQTAKMSFHGVVVLLFPAGERWT